MDIDGVTQRSRMSRLCWTSNVQLVDAGEATVQDLNRLRRERLTRKPEERLGGVAGPAPGSSRLRFQ
jgi:hypothetical protein